ncbi:MAG: single-stranded-DNA-specific exonuclease RecJ [Lachnospiraceae bacterium]|nr:single-stranded-DNA-specific exonuclease RecJ [Lachnospiraceae bacterium]
MKNWYVANKKADFNTIALKYGISPILARIIRNRDITEDDQIDMYLNGRPEDMRDPHLMKDMDKAVSILYKAIGEGKRILIIGDYDIDGVCSSYILLKGIMEAGGTADVRLPERMTDGYGMNMGMVDEALKSGTGLIITCDNGISASEEIRYAVDKGIDVIVTDHHEVPYEETDTGKKYKLPPANAVVDPKQDDCPYLFKEICGGMVAYKLIQCLFEKAGCSDKKELLRELLMFAGFATVGDVMELRDENRIAVKYAIKEMKTTKNFGMNCLIDVQKVDRSRLSPYHIGFILGPCINATGRLDSPKRALEMFMKGNHEEALSIALELKDLNDKRKDMTDHYTKLAVDMVNGSGELSSDRVLCVYLPECHESIAGIVAGKLREAFYKPSFVLTKGGEEVKGSGRSIEAYDMHAEMIKCEDLFIKFGGHKAAAGLSMYEDKIDELRQRLNANCTLTEDDLTEKITADMRMPVEYVSLGLARELDRLEPYGNGNRKPMFAEKDLAAEDIRVFGKNRNVVKMKLKSANGGNAGADAICFGDGDRIAEELRSKDKLSIMYELSVNEYMGTERVELVLKEWK